MAEEMLPTALRAIPTQIIHCRDDTYSHYSEAVQIAKNFPSVSLELLNSGGHLQVYNDPDVPARHVQSFIENNTHSTHEVSLCKSQTILG